MEHSTSGSSIDRRIAEHLKTLRAERGWSLQEVAQRSKVSRATLSRLENAEVSATAVVLGKLCAVYGLTMSRLMREVEEGFEPLVREKNQQVWTDRTIGFRRRLVSPPAKPLAGEAIVCELAPGTRIAYEAPPRPGLEHHLLLIDGQLAVTLDGHRYDVRAGDCLRYLLFGRSEFSTPNDRVAYYILFMV